MKTKLLLLSLFCTASFSSISAQVGVGTTQPKGALDVVSSDSGMLIPRVQLTAFMVAAPINNPQGGALVNGTLVYNVGPVLPDNMVAGFYYWNIDRWVALSGGSTLPTSDAWLLNGNAGTNSATNFVGTTDNVDLHFRTNGSNKFRIPAATNQILGYGGTIASPTYSWAGAINTGMSLVNQGTSSQILFSTGSTTTPTIGVSRFRIPNAYQVHAMDRGTATLPFYSYSADTDTGIFSPGSKQLGFSTAGSEKMRVMGTGQVGIGTTTPNAALDITSTTNGFLAPRIILSATNVSAPVVNPNGGGAPLAGTIVYNTATAGTVPNNVTPGYYYWDGAKWVRMAGGATTPHNTLDMAYDEGGAGVGRTIVADAGAVVISGNSIDSGLDIINTSTTSGVSGQYNAVINNNTIGYIADVNADGVGVYIDHNDTNNPYSALQVTTYSNNATSAGIFAKTEATSPALAVEGGRADNSIATPNAMTVTNFRTNGGAAIDAIAAIGIRSTSQTAGGSAYSGYLNAISGAAAQFNGSSTAPINVISNFSFFNPVAGLRVGTVSKGNRLGVYSAFTGITGSAFEGYMEAYNLDVYYATAIALNNVYDVYFRSSQPREVESKKIIANVIGPGVNATTIKKEDKIYVMPAVSAPESLFQDYGTGTLVNGRASISINPILTENILVDEKHPLKVFVQLEGECNGVYVTNKSAVGFEVVELGNGTSNVEFSYSLIASRASVEITTKDGSTETLNYSGRFMNMNSSKEEMKLIEDKREETKLMKRMIDARKEIKKETK